ncbi:UDP-N-acetylglucosamine 1-carboxyvinyltransferase [bacterium]|nr:UDP-N-acetylglucosamine 1-carboxyvinyltransferase [bacterium]
MGKFIINGGNKLYGEVKIQSAKNAVLPLFAAALLTEEEIIIKNVPDLIDVDNMIKIICNIGAVVKKEEHTVSIKAQDITSHNIPNSLAKELRSSIFLLGAVLSRKKHAKVAFPGGCDIGMRPIDIHIKGLRDLNVKIEEKAGYIFCDATKLICGEINLDYPSVGATENVMLAAVMANGRTIIHNAACEPEIVDLQNFLNKMGAKIYGAGSSVVVIEGVKKLHGITYEAMPDRIVAGTYLLATAICGGEVLLKNAKMEDIRSLCAKLSKSSCHIEHFNDNILIKAETRPTSVVSVTTQPYPGFPTDLQAPMMTLQSVSEGICVITENIFENRFRHVSELRKMGADIMINNRTAVIKGVPRLTAAEVNAQDLRGGAALVLAGLNAKGTTIINDIYHIDRGYQSIEKVFTKLGADIIRV